MEDTTRCIDVIKKRDFRFDGIVLPDMRGPSTAIVTLALTADPENRPICLVTAHAHGVDGTLAMTILWCVAEETLANGERRPLRENPLFSTLYKIYSSYHRNDAHAGTPRQEECLSTAIRTRRLVNPNAAQVVDFLKSQHVYLDETVRDATGCAHRYGHGRVYAEIPDGDLALIRRLIVKGYDNQPKEVTANADHRTNDGTI